MTRCCRARTALEIIAPLQVWKVGLDELTVQRYDVEKGFNSRRAPSY